MRRDAPLHEQAIDGGVDVVRLDAKPDRQGALRVEVHQQDTPPLLGQGRSEVDSGRRLADATLLIADGDDPGRTMHLKRHGVGENRHGSPGVP